MVGAGLGGKTREKGVVGVFGRRGLNPRNRVVPTVCWEFFVAKGNLIAQNLPTGFSRESLGDLSPRGRRSDLSLSFRGNSLRFIVAEGRNPAW